MNNIIDKFTEVVSRFEDLERQMTDPEVIADQSNYRTIVKKHAELAEAVAIYRKYEKIEASIQDAQELLSDPELKIMAEAELADLKPEKEELLKQLQIFLLPKDPNDHKNAVFEIRCGTGGEEAALFAGELFRMYTRYAERRGWTVELMSENATELGGIKEVVFVISGLNAYSRLKFESGTHRVQRVPETESSGRVHTSAATVAILPEAEDVDIQIDTKDLRIDVYRASGAGGQHVNKTSSAVRITHIPSGVVVACQDERSQFQNKDKAMRVLKTRLFEAKQEEQNKAEAHLRKSQVGSGDRSEKIRTYNYPQNRVTDHRINLTLHSLTEILDGKLDPLMDGLIAADQLAKMSA